MLDYYGKHRMVERIEDLYQRHRQMPREDLRTALISWDIGHELQYFQTR